MPESIHQRNKERLDEEMKQKQQLQSSKYKKLKSDYMDAKKIEDEVMEELGEEAFNKESSLDSHRDMERQVTFVPRPPPPREAQPNPISRRHIRGAKIASILPKVNFDGETNMLVIFDQIRQQPAGFFLYLSHIYSKNSNNYNFYNVK